MLNFLVDKAIERTGNHSDSKQPIFTISYSSIHNKPKSLHSKELQSKTIHKQIPKIQTKDHNIFQKWKSKTLQKLKDHKTPLNNSFFPLQPTKNLSVKLKSSPRCINLQSQSPKLQSELNSLKTSFIVHKKKNKSKAYSFQQSPKKQKQSPMKSVYLQYKDQNKQKKKKIITLSNFYQKKLMQNRIIKTIESSNVQKSENSDHEDQSRIKRPKKNVSFFNTIQYRTVPKQEIRHYKNDEFDHSKRHILSRVENTFIRTTKDTPKEDYNIFESAVTTLRAAKLSDPRQELTEEARNQNSSSQTVNIRKVYTEKRSRKLMRDLTEDPETLRVNINNCRPWSPVKTNPLFIHEEDLLFEQSRTFNIFSSLQEASQDMF